MSTDSLARERANLPPAKLPLGQAIKRSYSIFFSHFGDVLRITWLWLLIVVPISGYCMWLHGQKLPAIFDAIKKGQPPMTTPSSLRDGVIQYGPSLLMVVAGTSIAVAWHRLLVLGERPGVSGSNLVTVNSGRYLLTGLTVGLIFYLPLLLISQLIPTAGAHPNPMVALFLLLTYVVWIFAAVIALRISLLLPARAVSDTDLTAWQAWVRTRGNTWRMIWGSIACSLVIPIAVQLMTYPLGGYPTFGNIASEGFPTRFAIFGVISTITYILTMPIAIGFLTIAYGHFFDKA